MKRLIPILAVLALSGCAATKGEIELNKAKMAAWERANKDRTMTTFKLTGVTEIKGQNMTLEAQTPLNPLAPPAADWDTSDTDMAKHVATMLGIVGNGYVAGSNAGTKSSSVGGDQVTGYQSNPVTTTTTSTSTVAP